ncbi:MAG: transposase [Rhodobacteraceae bacterium]|nr:transposase [Paracoccaceae bacterium]
MVRAWVIKELVISLRINIHGGWVLKCWKRCSVGPCVYRREPMRESACILRDHLLGIISAVLLKVSNGLAESFNSRIKMIKLESRGSQNKQYFIADIYFLLRGLDLYPEGVYS